MSEGVRWLQGFVMWKPVRGKDVFLEGELSDQGVVW